MNKQRRKEIEKISDQLMELQAALTDLRGEEEEAYENLPESIQYSERGDAMQEAMDAMDNADGSIQEAIDYLMDLL